MDPNAALEQIRDLLKDLDTADPNKVSQEWISGTAEELCWLIDSLDCWLTKGGSLPTAWKGQDK